MCPEVPLRSATIPIVNPQVAALPLMRVALSVGMSIRHGGEIRMICWLIYFQLDQKNKLDATFFHEIEQLKRVCVGKINPKSFLRSV